eukprot:TRINITY_DN2615_c1_g1_i1.p1 TRINITY_DN2615_c1_g1~~TRINITY_DN2615_c1_g1_i1.p1  ORF type:complete len:631 (-),score=258.59 TRINITY_DN2615_c1_g1_i1:25-1917(-)
MSWCVRKWQGFKKVASEDLEEARKEKDSLSASIIFITLLPYLWPQKKPVIRLYVVLSIILMLLSKLATVATPIAMKHAIDDLSPEAEHDMTFPVYWVLAYGLLRLASKGCSDLRDSTFVNVTQNALRTAALDTFVHLHKLSLRFHTNRQTGTVLRAIERGTQGISFLLVFVLFNIGPTILEILMVCAIMFYLYEVWFAVITACTMIIYIVYTLSITQWRIKFRREMNDLNNEANNKAVDSLLNFETVKYFGNEEHEAQRYDAALLGYMKGALKSQLSLALLNIGQALVIAVGVVGVMLLAAWRVYHGHMSIGDFVLVNTYLLQLYVPLNFLGTSFRLIRSSLVDLENMFLLLDELPEVQDASLSALQVPAGRVVFDSVSFGYSEERAVLDGVSFTIEPGCMLAIVGPTGSGKTTISRLLFRFYDVDGGSISIDGTDISEVSQNSLRRSIGVVPQDTVLFNDSIRYNIRYGRLDATDGEVEEAARLAEIHDFVEGQPDGYDTVVGERGLRLSGGEKQRVSIARAILKNPPVMVFDEATSALDSETERRIQEALERVSEGRTSLVIAHRLSTVVHADEIIVLDQGRVVERGKHSELVQRDGVYAGMWRQQQDSRGGEHAGDADAALVSVDLE